MHINSVCTNTCTQNIHVHTRTPRPPHLCVNELFLWRGQVERSQSFQPKKSIASSWIIEMFAISFFTKKKSHCSMFPPAAHSLLLPCDIMTWRHKFLHRKVFILLMACNAVFEYLFLLSSVSCIYAHTHFSHIATVVLLPALSWGGAAASKKNHFVAKILIFPLLPSAVLMYWCSETESRLLCWTARHH